MRSWKLPIYLTFIFTALYYGRSQDFLDGGTLRKFSKDFLIKVRKCIILAYFQKNLTNHALIFRAFGRKTRIVGKILENCKNPLF